MSRKPKTKASYPVVRDQMVGKWTTGRRYRGIVFKLWIGSTHEASTPEELSQGVAEVVSRMARKRGFVT